MGIDTKNAVKNMIKHGIVNSVDPKTMTARVIFEDADNNISAPLYIANRGSKCTRDYWLPDVGEQVICIFEPNDKNASTGWIIGSYFSDPVPPQVNDADVHRIDFSDGSYIEHNRKTHEMTIKCAGNLNIIGAMVYIN